MKLRKVPKQRTNLFKILEAKRTSNATGKHKDKRKIEAEKLVKKGYYD
jgi:hypothetical protein